MFQHEHKHEHTANEPPDHSSVAKSFVCGSFAGAIQALVICPTEHVKCRLQVQSTSSITNYKGPLDAVSQIFENGGLRGLYRGFACTAWREVPAFGLYFAAYDSIKETVVSNMEKVLDKSNEGGGSTIHTWAASCIAGGISGALTWASIYPFDVIKTKIQTLPLDTPIEKRRISHIYKSIIQEHGWKFFFRGLNVTLLRAFPVNAIIFPVYEFTLEKLSENQIGC